MEQPEAWTTHQAVLPSALASSSIACMKVAGSTSRPSQLVGMSMRNSCASCSAESTSGAISRSRSVRAACAAIREPSARARAMQSLALLHGRSSFQHRSLPFAPVLWRIRHAGQCAAPAHQPMQAGARDTAVQDRHDQEDGAHRDLVDVGRSADRVEAGAQHRETEHAHRDAERPPRAAGKRHAAEDRGRGGRNDDVGQARGRCRRQAVAQERAGQSGAESGESRRCRSPARRR